MFSIGDVIVDKYVPAILNKYNLYQVIEITNECYTLQHIKVEKDNSIIKSFVHPLQNKVDIDKYYILKFSEHKSRLERIISGE